MNTDKDKRINTELLYSDITYKIRGAMMDVSNKYGKGLKEVVYQNALAEAFMQRGLKFEKEKRITIHSVDTGKVLGYYTPDYIVEQKIIVELKASDFTSRQNVGQELSYLKASKYEVGFLVNFNTPKLDIKRLIYTNDRKPAIRVNP